MKDEYIATDDNTEREEAIADDKVEGDDETEAELGRGEYGGYNDDGRDAVDDAEEAVREYQPVQECLRGLLDEEVDQRSVGGDGQETRRRGGGHHGEGGVALPSIGPEMLQNCCDLDSFMRHVVCCHGEIHVDTVVVSVDLSF